MTRFVAKKNLLVLCKNIKQTKKDENGSYKEYGTLSLYDKDADEFFKITVFENYKDILNRYDVLKTYNIDVQITIISKDGNSTARMSII